MLNQKDLLELLDYDAAHPILSIYLNTEPTKGNADVHKLRLRTMLKKVDAPKDVDIIERFFDHEYDWSGQGIAIFSCAPEDYFINYPLDIPVQDHIQYSMQPSIKPLAAILNQFVGYGVALVDKQEIRLLAFHLGEIKAEETFSGEEIRHMKRGGASAVPGNRGGVSGLTGYEDEMIDRNMKEAAEMAAKFFEDHHIQRIFIGGSEDNIPLFKAQLPKSWQSLLVDTFSISMNVSSNDILKKILEIGQLHEEHRQKHLVEKTITTAAKGGNAVLGLNETLLAVNNKQIDTLLITDDFYQPGYSCSKCELLAADFLKNCSICNGEMQAVPDLIDLAVGSVLQAGGYIEVIPENIELQKAGNIGAILRY